MHDSLWNATTRTTSFPSLTEDLRVEVAVVGGGITGLTAATRLAQAGKSVALLEASHIGGGVTARTTAHLTEAVDSRYSMIEKDFGEEGARMVAASSRAAIEQIAMFVRTESIPCAFERLGGYLYTERKRDLEILEKELVAMQRAGLRAEFVREVPVPFSVEGAVRVDDQGQFHALEYAYGLAMACRSKGGLLFQNTRVLSVDEGDVCRLHTQGGPTVTANKVILATNAPLNAMLFGTKIAQYRSYVVAFAVPFRIAALLWDTDEPYHYTRSAVVGEQPYLVIGGEDHKTGKESDTEGRFRTLVDYARERFGVGEPAFRWSAQVVEPVDGLPFIGSNTASERVFLATGYSGNGMTFGTLAGMILSDLARDLPNPYAELYSARRVKPMAGLSSFLGENVDFPMHLVSDYLMPPEARSLDEIAPGEGKTARINGRRVAVYRSETGELHAVTSVCTHLGCQVRFNKAERSWDCPCHGSRFDIDGSVINGPATRSLEPWPVE